MNWIVRCYTLFLYLYPQGFRDHFFLEMQAVFAKGLANASQRGWLARIGFMFNEALGLPASLVSVYGWLLKRKEGQMMSSLNATSLSGVGDVAVEGRPPSAGDTGPATWRESFLSGLPHLIIALTIGLPPLVMAANLFTTNQDLGTFINNAVSVVLLLIAAVSLILVWRMRWPRWGASWGLLWFITSIVVASFVVGSLTNHAGWTDLTGMTGEVIIPLAIAYFFYRLTCRDRILGLLVALPLMVVIWMPLQEFVPNGPRGAASIWAWSLSGLAAILIFRLNRPVAGLAIALVMAALAGFPFAYLGIYQGGALPGSEPGPSLRMVFQTFVPDLALCCSLVLGPLLACQFRDLSQRSRPYGTWIYRLALFGLLLLMVMVILSVFLTSHDWIFAAYRGMIALFPALILIGVTIYGAGFLVLIKAAGRTGIPLHLPELSGLFLLPLGVPFSALLFGLPNRILTLPWLPVPAQMAIELVWIVLSTWLVIRVHGGPGWQTQIP